VTEEHGSATENVVSRRRFIEGLGLTAAGAAAGVIIGVAIPVGGDEEGTDDGHDETAATPGGTPTPGQPGAIPAVVTAHPRVKVATLSELSDGDVIDFKYPSEQSAVSLVKLGRRADGGIGPDGDVVAFGTDCTHMGCPLAGTFKVEYGILGPCGCHFTTFDLGRRGSVVLGQATENLPQILLDLDGDDIYAVGTLGILYGFRDNLADAPIVEGI
jgi:arsenite oxidase small subunit